MFRLAVTFALICFLQAHALSARQEVVAPFMEPTKHEVALSLSVIVAVTSGLVFLCGAINSIVESFSTYDVYQCPKNSSPNITSCKNGCVRKKARSKECDACKGAKCVSSNGTEYVEPVPKTKTETDEARHNLKVVWVSAAVFFGSLMYPLTSWLLNKRGEAGENEVSV